MNSNQNTALLPLYYLPNIAYLSAIAYYLGIYIEQFENYQKRSFRNRCFIGTSQGRLQLSIPLQSGKNEQQAIKLVKIDNQQFWQRQHWRSIVTAYSSAPFWEHYADGLAPFFERKYIFLWDWNLDLLNWLLQKLKINKSLYFTNEYIVTNAAEVVDFRPLINIQPVDNQQDINFNCETYPQLFTDRQGFLANLSGLDALFCMGNLTVDYLKSCR